MVYILSLLLHAVAGCWVSKISYSYSINFVSNAVWPLNSFAGGKIWEPDNHHIHMHQYLHIKFTQALIEKRSCHWLAMVPRSKTEHNNYCVGPYKTTLL